MKNIDIEKFYHKIDGHIKIAAAYTGNEFLPQIIRSFRLKPDSCFDKGFDFSTHLERCWNDEYGGSIRIIGEQLKISLCDLHINRKAQTKTDLFYGRSIKEISKDSNFVLIATKKDIDMTYIVFYGNDGFMRAYIGYGYSPIRTSPLVMGLKAANAIFVNINKTAKILDKEQLDCLIPYGIDKIITSPWPIGKDMVSFLDSKIIGELVE